MISSGSSQLCDRRYLKLPPESVFEVAIGAMSLRWGAKMRAAVSHHCIMRGWRKYWYK